MGKKMVLLALTGWGHDEDHCKSSEAEFDALMKQLAELLPMPV